MRITLLVAALVVIGLSAARAAPDATYMGGGQIVRVADEKFENIPAGAAVYIENVDAEFGADFRSELARQKVALKIVSTPDEALFLIVGSAKPDETKLRQEGPGTLILNVRRGGKVSVQDKAKSTTLWSGTWEVRSLSPDDLKKAASNLVGKLKKAIR